jgi:hypothetical protein
MSFSKLSATGIVLAGGAAVLVLARVNAEPDSGQASSQIDHVIVAISDLETGIERFEELSGVRPVFGGKHPGAGTQNALVALGSRVYLEILAPQTDAEPPPERAELLELEQLTPLGWAATSTDMANTIALLQGEGYTTTGAAPGSRAKPDGTTLGWVTTAISEPAVVGAPFFIQWDASSAHPATTSPTGCSIESLTVTTNTADALRHLITALQLDVTVEQASVPTERYRLVLQCPKGRVTLE